MPCFRIHFDSQRAKIYTKALLSSFFITLENIELENFSFREMSEILELFVNTLTADDKYSPCNSENLPQPI